MPSTLSIGMLVGGVAKDVKQAGVIASILYFPMLIFSGTTLPLEVMPPAMQKIVSFFPLTQGLTIRRTAQNNGDPRHVKRKRLPLQQTANNRSAGDHKAGNVPPDTAPFQQVLQFFHKCFHTQPLFYTIGGICILCPYGYALSRKKQPARLLF